MARFIHRSATIALMCALVVGSLAFGGGTAQAQGTGAPGSWQSSINLQNTAGEPAVVTITFYNSDGGVVTSYTPTEAIPAGGALSIFVPQAVAALPSGQFSAVVSSNVAVRATVNTASTNSNAAPWTAFGYEGGEAKASDTTLYFPGNYKNYFGFLSEMVIQNAGTSNATLTARFFNKDGAQIATAALGALAANASKTFSMATLAASPALPSGNTGLFGAVVTSSEGNIPLVGVVNIWRTGEPKGTASYNGFTGGGASVYAPALYKNYYSFTSALTIQNIDAVPANVTLTYANGTVENFTLAANASREFYQPNNAALPSGNTAGVFGATATSTGGKIVGLASLGASGGKGDFASYNAPNQASNRVDIANVLSDYYGYFTAVTVQNVCASPTNVTIRYANGQERTIPNVPANGATNIIHLNNAGDVLANQVSTSAEVSASNAACNLVAVIQHGTAANVNGYNAAKVPSDYLLALSGSAK